MLATSDFALKKAEILESETRTRSLSSWIVAVAVVVVVDVITCILPTRRRNNWVTCMVGTGVRSIGLLTLDYVTSGPLCLSRFPWEKYSSMICLFP